MHQITLHLFFTIVAEDCPHEMKLWAGVAKQTLKIKGVPCWFTSNRYLNCLVSIDLAASPQAPEGC